MKTIRTKILSSIIIITLVVLLVTGGIASIMNFSSTVETLQLTLSQAVIIASNQVAAEIKAYKNTLTEFTYSAALMENAPLAERLAMLRSMQDSQGYVSLVMTDATGRDVAGGGSIADSEGFQQAQSRSEAVITGPVAQGDAMIVYITVPIEKNNQFSGVIMAGLDASFLTAIVSDIHVGNGNAAILDKSGNTIGFAEYDLVLQQYNTQNEVKNDPSLARLAELERIMVQGEPGFGSYHYNGQDKMMAFCPIPGTDGWSIDISVVQKEFMGGTYRSLFITLCIIIVSMVVAVILAFCLSGSIARPIKNMADRLRLLADGDLHTEVPAVKTRDETAQLATALSETIEDMREIINDITRHLGRMSQGDFSALIDQDYKGDFQPIQIAMRGISGALNQTLQEIGVSANEVSSGADQVSAGAQALAQGATEQASAVEELAATIDEISKHINSTSHSATDASAQAERTNVRLDESNQEMQKLTSAITQISTASGEIGKVIKTIEDIAFQTNILALNAAVEAARAGAAGKGFAVVADEVRNLANKSQEAAKNTTGMIEESIHAVESGTRIADATALSMLAVVDDTRHVVSEVGKINLAAKQQAESLSQVTIGVDQISAVVQTNSATAEESAAASAQLNAQAQHLKELVSQFRLQSGLE